MPNRTDFMLSRNSVMKRSSLNRFGKKAKLRETINKRNRVRFKAMGLFDVCELHLEGCWGSRCLTWMHAKKDRLLTMWEREFLVIRACVICHDKGELSGHEKMFNLVMGAIKNRHVNAY